MKLIRSVAVGALLLVYASCGGFDSSSEEDAPSRAPSDRQGGQSVDPDTGEVLSTAQPDGEGDRSSADATTAVDSSSSQAGDQVPLDEAAAPEPGAEQLNPSEAALNFTPAPDFPAPIIVEPNRSSVMLKLPSVPGAKDYRVFVVESGVTTKIVGDTEEILGATITCAGLRQRNDCDDSEAVKEYGDSEIMLAANCADDVRSINIPKSVAQILEVNDLRGPTKIVVEAIDTLCPFVGAIGNAHVDVPIVGADAPFTTTYKGDLVTFTVYQSSFPIRTVEEVRAEYGSVIFNGHGHAPRPADPLLGPYRNVAQPAPRVAPKVLSRSVMMVTPTGTAERPAGYKPSDIFDDFSDDADQFKLIRERKYVEGVILPEGLANVAGVRHYANSRWNWYTFNADAAQVFVGRGQLHNVIADMGQDVMASNVVYPKRTVQLPDTDSEYLHISFEVQANATQRRYWWLHLCGAAEAGKTYEGTTFPPTSGILARPFFMDPASGMQISLAGWNCLQFVPRAGGYDVSEGGEFSNPVLGGSRSQSSLRILQNRATPAGVDPTTDNNSVVLLDPAIEAGETQAAAGQWTRSWDADHKINGVLLDDQLYVAQRTKFDVYVNRGRVVLFVNGKQKVCDSFPTKRLTMAEAAVGLGSVFYHSQAERVELMSQMWVKTGQNYYLHNTPFVDVRSFDNLGIREQVALPSSYDAKPCFTTP